MTTTNKQPYTAPAIDVLEVEHEGLIATSGGVNNFTGGGDPFAPINASRRGSRSGLNYSSVNDLEDLISNILTFEK